MLSVADNCDVIFFITIYIHWAFATYQPKTSMFLGKFNHHNNLKMKMFLLSIISQDETQNIVMKEFH